MTKEGKKTSWGLLIGRVLMDNIACAPVFNLILQIIGDY